MAEHKMYVLDGVRYREEDLPEGSKNKATAESAARVVEPTTSGQAKVISSPKRSNRTAAPAQTTTDGSDTDGGDSGKEK